MDLKELQYSRVSLHEAPTKNIQLLELALYLLALSDMKHCSPASRAIIAVDHVFQLVEVLKKEYFSIIKMNFMSIEKMNV